MQHLCNLCNNQIEGYQKHSELGMVVYAYNPSSTQEAYEGGFQIQDQPGLYGKTLPQKKKSKNERTIGMKSSEQ